MPATTVKSPSAETRAGQVKLLAGPAKPPRADDIFKLFTGEDKVLIIISADPDAIASAVALKRLLWRKVASIGACSLNQVNRLDNLKLLAYLKLALPLFSQVNLANYSKLAMVDSQPHHHDLTKNLTFSLIIDHHPLGATSALAPAETGGNAKQQIIDIRPDYGAVASMMSEYLRQANICPNHKLATALFYAIKTDTQNFVRQGQLDDMHAFRWLYPYINQHALLDIERKTLSRRSFRCLINGLKQVNFKSRHAYAFMEKADSPDTMVIMADFLLNVDNISLVVVAGLFKNHVTLIFRGTGRLNVGRLAREAFEAYGAAGGHKTMARCELPLAKLECRPAHKNGRPCSAAAINRFILKQLNQWHAKHGHHDFSPEPAAFTERTKLRDSQRAPTTAPKSKISRGRDE